MERKTQMNGIRLGFTYAAAIIVLALLIANFNTPPSADAGLSAVSENSSG